MCLISRLSNNSKSEHFNHHVDKVETNSQLNKEFPRVNTPAKLTQPPCSIDGQLNEGMVSPKRKVEHFQHLYIANNVKTSTFNEQTDKNNIISNKNNLNNCHEYNKNNMVPERDTDSKTTSENPMGTLNLSPQGTSNSRHHHVTIQELRLQQVRRELIFPSVFPKFQQQRAQNCNSSSDENRSSGHASMSDNGNSSPRGNYSSGTDRLTAGVMQKSLKNRASTQHNRSRHRATPARVS